MEKYRDEMIDFLMKALTFDGEQGEVADGAPFGQGNTDCLNFFLDKAREIGFKTVNMDGYAGYADIGEGPSFGILGHVDTVPVGEGWTANPYGEIRDGVIYGRGVLDDRGPIVSCLFAVKALLAEGLRPKRRIRFIIGCNEETGWACMDHYLETEKMPDTGFSPDADFPVINCEKGHAVYVYSKEYSGDVEISGGTRPNIVPDFCEASLPLNDKNLAVVKKSGLEYREDGDRIKVTSRGLAAHASLPDLGDNAIVKMLKALAPADREIADLSEAFAGTDGSGLGIACSDDKSGALTMNLGILNIGFGNILLMMDIRSPVTVTEKDLSGKIGKRLSSYELNGTNYQEPLYVDKDDELVKTLVDTYNSVTGDNREAIAVGGATYARVMKHGVAFGPEFPDRESTIHMPDERVSVEDFMLTSKIYKEAIRRLCF